MVVQFGPQIGDHPQPHKIHQIGLEVIEDPLQQEENDDDEGKEKKFLCILVDEDLVQGRLDHVGLTTLQSRDEDHADHCNDEFAPIGSDEFKKATIEIHKSILRYVSPFCKRVKLRGVQGFKGPRVQENVLPSEKGFSYS